MQSENSSRGAQRHYLERVIPYENLEFLKFIAKDIYAEFRDVASQKQIEIKFKRNKNLKQGLNIVLKSLTRLEKNENSELLPGQKNSHILIQEDLLQLETQIVDALIENEKQFEIWCHPLNIDEYNFIVQHQLKHLKIELNYYPHDSIGGYADQLAVDTLEIQKRYSLNESYSINIAKLKDLQYLNLETIDYFFINIDEDGVFLDNFAPEYYGHPFLYTNYKQNKKSIFQRLKSTSNQYWVMTEEQLDGHCLKIVYLVNRKNNFQAQLKFENLQNFLQQLEKSQQEANEYYNFLIPIPMEESEMYLQLFLSFLNKSESNSVQDDSLTKLKFPSQFNLIITQYMKKSVMNMLDSINSGKLLQLEKLKVSERETWLIEDLKSNSYLIEEIPQNIQTIIDKFLSYKQSVFLYPYWKSNNNLMTPKLKTILKYTKELNEFIEEIPDLNQKRLIINTGGDLFFNDFEKDKIEEVQNILQQLILHFQPCGENFTFQYYRYQINLQIASSFAQINMENLSISLYNQNKEEQDTRFKIFKRKIFNYQKNNQINVEKINLREEQFNVTQDQKIVEEEEQQNQKNEVLSGRPLIKALGLKGEIEKLREFIKVKLDNPDSMKKLKLKFNSYSVLQEHMKIELSKLAQKNNFEIEYLGNPASSLKVIGFRQTLIANIQEFEDLMNLMSNENCSIPAYWSPEQTENCQLFTIEPTCEEFLQVLNRFNQTIDNHTIKIVKIQRIQNVSLWKNFNFEQNQLRLKGNDNEMYLFHGTRHNKPQLIYNATEDAFDYRFSAQGMFGRGAYFAERASYSMGYSFPSSEGNIFMLAKVLVGNFFISSPNSGLINAPFLPGSQTQRYDSVRSNYPEGTNMFIVYTNYKAYPEYLITFK